MLNKLAYIFWVFFFSTIACCCSKAGKKNEKLLNIPVRNELLIKRGDLLKIIELSLKNKDTFFSIIGMAGIGKTQLAKEYALTHKDAYDLIWWIDANQDFLAQFRELGQNLNAVRSCPIPDNIQISLEKWLDAVRLCSQRHFPRVLLIIDDVKNRDQIMTVNQTLKNISIILTSRNSTIKGNQMVLKTFTRKESLEYLNKSLPNNSESSLNELAESLNDYPLALSQAVAFIKSHPSLTLREYLHLYKEKKNKLWEEEEKLIQDQRKDYQQLPAYHLTVAATFTLLLEQIQQSSPYALEVLKFSSILGNQNIPKNLLKKWMIDHRHLTDFEFHDALSPLIRFSVFEKNEDTKDSEETYNIHAFLHEFIRDKLTKEGKESYLTQTTQLIESVLPKSSYKIWKVLFDDRYLTYHLETLLKLADENRFYSDDLLTLKIKYLSYIFFLKSDYKATLEKLPEIEELLKNNNTLDLFERGRFLTLAGNMATTRYNYEEAIRISEQAEQVFSSIHSQEAKEELFFLLVNNLMDFYNMKGNLQKAEEVSKKAEKLVPLISHPTYLAVYYVIRALQLLNKGQFNEACQHVDMALTKFYSSDFPEHFHIFNKIIKAEILAKEGKLDEAILLINKSQNEFEKYYPNESNYKVLKMSMIKAFLLLKKDQFEESYALINKTIAGFDALFKKDNENPVQAFSHIIRGEVYEQQGQFAEALRDYRKAEQIYSHIFKTIEVDDMSYLYKNFVLLGEKMKDEFIIKKYVKLLVDHFNLDHPNTKEAVLYLDERNISTFN